MMNVTRRQFLALSAAASALVITDVVVAMVMIIPLQKALQEEIMVQVQIQK